MSDKQALRDAVALAVKHGWKRPPEVEWWDWDHVVDRNEWWQVIFRHEFARAIWGDAMNEHLQHMVIADNPLRYLGEHLLQ